MSKINSTSLNLVAFKQNSEVSGSKPQKQQPKSTFSNYKDNFIRNSITIVPSSILLAGGWAWFDARKDMKTFGKHFLNNALLFGITSVAIAIIDSAFQTKRQNKNN